MTTFSFGSTALSSFGTVTPLGDSWDIPSRRGANQVIPFEDGALHVNKFWDQRIITIGITMQEATQQAMEGNIDDLNKLLALRTEQVLAKTLEDSTVRNINAVVNKPLQLAWFGPYIVKVVIEFVCAYPLWRLSSAIADNTTTIDASPKAMVVNNPGTVQERKPTIILTGPLLNTVITNSTLGYTLTYTGTIASPRVVTIQKTNGQWVATTDLGANVIDNITHSGDSCLMAFNPGNNTLSITDGTATTGTVKVTFSAPFI